MKFTKRILPLLALIFVLSSCYHAQITTDKQPSGEVIENQWAHSFVYGLVPPSEVEASSKCDNGVARVETKISFLNGLVRSLTGGLYTPMTITVTCAEGSGMAASKGDQQQPMSVAKGASDKKIAETIQKAAEKSNKLKNPVYIKFN